MTIGRHSLIAIICCSCTFRELVFSCVMDAFIPYSFSNLEAKCQKLFIIILALLLSSNTGDEHTSVGM